ncbi:MAG: heme-binding domain-containing protein [Anaerolineaceae bacterium]|nr:heme-binding domain-containing protein [Anaerolineaceae bacterium]
MSTKRIILGVLGVAVLGFLAIQFVPGYERTNPPVTQTINWSSAETEALMRRACYDCHSNETVWPWYSNIAPVSWLVVDDVNEGRRKLNFSTGHGEMEARELIEQIERGSMPPSKYLITHPEANLTTEEKAALIAGIRATSFR